MAGFSIQNTGTISAYDSNVSQSIINAFFQDTSVHNNSIALYNPYRGEWAYNGAYAFSINRNDPSGRNMYNNGVMSQYGGFRTYSYQHWSDDVYYDLNIHSDSPDDIYFLCEVKDPTTSFTQVFEYTQYGPGDYNSGLQYNLFTPGAANTDFTYRITISNLTNPNSGAYNIIAQDYDFADQYLNDAGPLDLVKQFVVPYYAPLQWFITIN